MATLGMSTGKRNVSIRQQKLRVLMWPDRSPNPFIPLLIENLGADYEVVGFTFRTALLSRYQVLHVHWPEVLVHSPSGLKRLVKLFLLIALIVLNRVRRVPHLWTVHNVKPHERNTLIEKFGLRLWAASCSKRVYLTRAGLESAADPNGVLILLGEYAWVRENNRAHITQAVPGQLIAFGLLRRYKSLESLIEAVRVLPSETGISLLLAGEPLPQEYGHELAKACNGDGRISLFPEFQTDAQLVQKITSSEIVVIPYGRVYNSAAALTALALARPIITTDSPTMRELRDEVGPEWVHCLKEGLSGESLLNAVNELRRYKRRGNPHLQNRDWLTVGAQYAELYNQLITRSSLNSNVEER
jgi:beta-1,4-mannosyltransferase